MACHTHTINSGASRGTPPVPPHEPYVKRSLTFTLTGRTDKDSINAPVPSAQCNGLLYRHLTERAWARRGIARRKRAPVQRHSALLYSELHERFVLPQTKRLNHRRRQAPQSKVSFFQRKGKKLHITSWVFWSNSAWSCQNFCNVAF